MSLDRYMIDQNELVTKVEKELTSLLKNDDPISKSLEQSLDQLSMNLKLFPGERSEQRNLEDKQILEKLHRELLLYLSESERNIQSPKVQGIRKLILEHLVKDINSRQNYLVSDALLAQLGKVLNLDNVENSLIAAKIFIESIKVIMNERFTKFYPDRKIAEPEKSVLVQSLQPILNSIQNCMPIFIDKMRIFSNLRENFSSPQDLFFFKKFLSKNSAVELQKQIDESANPDTFNNRFISNKYDFKVYEEITAIVTYIYLNLVKRIEQVVQILNPSIPIIKKSIMDFIVKGIDSFKTIDFEYTQFKYNRLFHEEIAIAHRNIIRYFQKIFENLSQPQESVEQEMLNNSRVIVSYTTRFPQEFVDTKILLLRDLVNCIQVSGWTKEDVNPFTNLNAFFNLNSVVSNQQKTDILYYQTQIIRMILQVQFDDPNKARTTSGAAGGQSSQQQQQAAKRLTHSKSWLRSIKEEDLFELLKKFINTLVTILYDNSIHLYVHVTTILILVQILQRYFMKDHDFFERQPLPNHAILDSQMQIIEQTLKFIGLKFKDINIRINKVIESLRKEFLKTDSQTNSNSNQPQNQNAGCASASQQSSSSKAAQVQKGQASGNGNCSGNNNNNSSNYDEDLARERRFEEWLISKKPPTNLNSFSRGGKPAKPRHSEDREDSAWKELCFEMIESNLNHTATPQEISNRPYSKEEIQAGMEGDFIQLNGFDLKDTIKDFLQDFTQSLLNHIINASHLLQEGIMYKRSQLISLQQQQQQIAAAAAAAAAAQTPSGDGSTPQQPLQQKIPAGIIAKISQSQIRIFRKIFKHGIQLFTTIHNLFHQENLNNNLYMFFYGFAQITDECNFKDIIEPNFPYLLQFMLKAQSAKTQCKCIKIITFDVFQKHNQKSSEKYFNQIILKNLLLQLDQSPSDVLDPFSEYFALYKHRFYDLIQKILHEIFGNIIRTYQDDSSKQIIKKILLFLFKKIHTSPYPLEFLKLLKWFVHKLMTMHDQQFKDQIRTEISQIYISQNRINEQAAIEDLNSQIEHLEVEIEKNSGNVQDQREQLKALKEKVKQFEGINIMDTMICLMDVNMSKFQIQVSKIYLMLKQFQINQLDLQQKKQAARMLLSCMQLLGRNMVSRSFDLMDQLLRKLSNEEIEEVLDGIKDELIEKLYEISREYQPIDFRASDKLKNQNKLPQLNTNHSNDPNVQRMNQRKNMHNLQSVPILRQMPENALQVMILLSRLSFLSKQHKPAIFIRENESEQQQHNQQLIQEQMFFEFASHVNSSNNKNNKNQPNPAFKLDFKPTVEHALAILIRINSNNSCQPLKFHVINTSFGILKFCVVKFFCAIEGTNDSKEDDLSYYLEDSYQRASNEGEDSSISNSGSRINFFWSSPERKHTSLPLIGRILMTLLDLLTIDQGMEKENGLLARMVKEIQRILNVIASLVGNSFLTFLQELMEAHPNMDTRTAIQRINAWVSRPNSPFSLFVQCVILSLKNQNFMERKPNQKIGACDTKQVLWNDIILNNIYKPLLSSISNKNISNSSNNNNNGSGDPRNNSSGIEEGALVYMEDLILTLIIRQIANVNDAYIPPSEFSRLQAETSDKQFKANSLNDWGNSQQFATESRMFDRKSNALSRRYCLMECLLEAMSAFKQEVLCSHLNNILDATFIVSNSLPEIVNLQSLQDFCRPVLSIILKNMKDTKSTIFSMNSAPFRMILSTFVSNLTSSKPISHLYSRDALKTISKIYKKDIISLLYLSSDSESKDIRFSAEFESLLAKKKDDLVEFYASEAQLATMPCAYDMTTLIRDHPRLLISQILMNCNLALSNFQSDYGKNPANYYQSTSILHNRRILTALNCFKTLEFLLQCENCLPFKMSTIDLRFDFFLQPQQQQLLPSSFIRISQAIMRQNNMQSKASRIILQNNLAQQPQAATAANQAQQPAGQVVPPINGQINPTAAAVNLQRQPINNNRPNPAAPAATINGIQVPARPSTTGTVGSTQAPGQAAGSAAAGAQGNRPGMPVTNKSPQLIINHFLLYQEDELGLSIEDLNFNTRNWSKLIASIATFLKQVNLICSPRFISGIERFNISLANSQNVAGVATQPAVVPSSREQQESSAMQIEGSSTESSTSQTVVAHVSQPHPQRTIDKDQAKVQIDKIKTDNLAILLDLIIRVEPTINFKAEECLNEISKKNEQTQVKGKASIEEHLFLVVRPILLCMQGPLSKFTPQLILIFKKFMKMLSNNFNYKLATELIQKLDKVILETNKHSDRSYSDFKIKCVSSYISLFSRLKESQLIPQTPAALQQAKQQANPQQGTMPQQQMPLTVKDQIKNILNKAIKLQMNYSYRYGDHFAKLKIIHPLCKFLCVQMESFCEILKERLPPPTSQETLSSQRNFLDNLYYILKMDQSYELRERMTREKTEGDLIASLWDQNKPYLIQLKIIYLLSSKNPRVFAKGNIESVVILIDCFNKFRDQCEKKGGISIFKVKEFILLTKIFILCFKRSRDLRLLMLIICKCCVETIPESNYFLMNFLHNEVPQMSFEIKVRILTECFPKLILDPKISLNTTRFIFVDLLNPIINSLTKEQISDLSRVTIEGKPYFERLFFIAQELQPPRQYSQMQQEPTGQVASLRVGVKISSNNEYFLWELTVLEIYRVIFRLLKELRTEQQPYRDLVGKIIRCSKIIKGDTENKDQMYDVKSIGSVEVLNPVVRQLYNQLYIEAYRDFGLPCDGHYLLRLTDNLLEGHYLGDQLEIYKNQYFFMRKLIANNIIALIRYLAKVMQMPNRPADLKENIKELLLLGEKKDKERIIHSAIIKFHEDFYEFKDLIEESMRRVLFQIHKSYVENFEVEKDCIDTFIANGFSLPPPEPSGQHPFTLFIQHKFFKDNSQPHLLMSNALTIIVAWNFKDLTDQFSKIPLVAGLPAGVAHSTENLKSESVESFQRCAEENVKREVIHTQHASIMEIEQEKANDNNKNNYIGGPNCSEKIEMELEHEIPGEKPRGSAEKDLKETLIGLAVNLSKIEVEEEESSKSDKISHEEILRQKWKLLETLNTKFNEFNVSLHEESRLEKKSQSQLQQKKESKVKSLGTQAVEFLILYIMDRATDDRMERYLFLLKKIFILWNDSEINYKMIYKKFVSVCIRIEEMDTQKQGYRTMYPQVLNLLTVCLEVQTVDSILDSLSDIVSILRWSVLHQKQLNKPQQNNLPANPANRKGRIEMDEKKRHQSILNENESYIVLMTSNIMQILLEVCEFDKHANQSKNFWFELKDLLEESMLEHFTKQKPSSINNSSNNLPAGQKSAATAPNQQVQPRKEEQPSRSTISKELTAKILLSMRNLSEKVKVKLPRLCEMLKEQAEKIVLEEFDTDRIMFEYYFSPKYAHYIPYNSQLYATSRNTDEFHLIDAYLEEKFDYQNANFGESPLEQFVLQQVERVKESQAQIKREGGFETTQLDIDQHFTFRESYFKRNIFARDEDKYPLAPNFISYLQIFWIVASTPQEDEQIFQKDDPNYTAVTDMINVLLKIIDSSSFYHIRMEALTILRLLYLGPENFKDKKVPVRLQAIKKLSQIIQVDRAESIKWIFRNVQTSFARFARFYNDNYVETINYLHSYRLAEENISFHFLKFLVDLLDLEFLSLKEFHPHILRKFTAIFSEVQHSDSIRRLFSMVERTEDFNQLTSMFYMMGQSKYKGPDPGKRKVDHSNEVSTHLVEDDGNFSSQWDHDDQYLMSFKFLLHQIRNRFSSVTFSLSDFSSKFSLKKQIPQDDCSEKRLTKTTIPKETAKEVRILLDEIHEFDKKRQIEFLLESMQDMMLSNGKKSSITNDIKSHEETRYMVLEEKNVSKNHPINNKLLLPAFFESMKFYLNMCSTQATRVLLLQSIEEHLLFFTSNQYNPYGNIAYSSPPPNLQLGDDKRLSKNWAYALFEIFFTEFEQTIPFVICPARVYQIVRTHHCWDLGQMYLEKIIELSTRDACKLPADSAQEAYERLQQIAADISDSDSMYGVINVMLGESNPYLLKSISALQQQEFMKAQISLLDYEPLLSDQMNELLSNNQEGDDLEAAAYGAYTSDYRTVYTQATFRQLLIETQKGLNEWDSLSSFGSKDYDCNEALVIEALNPVQHLQELKKLLEKDSVLPKEISSEFECYKQQVHYPLTFLNHQTNILSVFNSREPMSHMLDHLYKANIQIGYEWHSLPNYVTKAHHHLLTQLQAVQELEESYMIFHKFNSHSNIDFKQFLEFLLSTIQVWRERLPHKYDSLKSWRLLVNQRDLLLQLVHDQMNDILKNRVNLTNPNPIQNQILMQHLQEYLMQFADFNWNNYQYLRVLQSYGIMNTKRPGNGKQVPLNPEDAFLRMNWHLKNQMLFHSEKESVFGEIKDLRDQFESAIKNLRFAQYDDCLSSFASIVKFKETKLLYKKSEHFDSLMNFNELLKNSGMVGKASSLYLKICYSMLEQTQQHKEYFQRLIVTLLPKALTYKPYQSRMLGVLFFSLFETMTTSMLAAKEELSEEVKSMWGTCFESIPSHVFVLWAPKIFQFLAKRTPFDSIFIQIINSKLLKKHEQFLFLQLRPLLLVSSSESHPSSGGSNNNHGEQSKWLLHLYKTMKSQNISNRIEFVLKKLLKPYSLQSPSNNSNNNNNNRSNSNNNNNINLNSADLIFATISSILESVSAALNVEEYSSIVQKSIPDLINVLKTFGATHIEGIDEAINRLTGNATIPVEELISVLRFQILVPLKKSMEKVVPSILEYSVSDLFQFTNESSEVEIFGQYVVKNPIIFTEFKNHLYMASLQKEVDIFIRSYRIIRRIAINASNEKQYLYETEYEPEEKFHQISGNSRVTQQENGALRSQFVDTFTQCLNSQFFKNRETFTRGLQISQRFKLPFQNVKRFMNSLKATSRSLFTMQDVLDMHLQAIADSKFIEYHSESNNLMVKEEDIEQSKKDKVHTHLNGFNKFNGRNQINVRMKSNVAVSALASFVLSKCLTYQEYINFRREFTTNYAAATFLGFLLGQSPKLNAIAFDYASGSVFISTNNLEIRKDAAVTYKNPNSIRLSRCISYFIGDIGLSGIFASSFVSMARAITKKEQTISYVPLVYPITQDMVQLNELNDPEAAKKFNEKVKWIYSDENEDVTSGTKIGISGRIHSIIAVIQQGQASNAASLAQKYWF